MSSKVQFAHEAVAISTFDPTFDPSLLSMSSTRDVPVGSRYEEVPHNGPGTAVYVRQPTRAQLQKVNAGLFGNPNRPFYIRDPEGKRFVDVDGKEAGPRWILIDPEGRVGSPPVDEPRVKDNKGCCTM